MDTSPVRDEDRSEGLDDEFDAAVWTRALDDPEPLTALDDDPEPQSLTPPPVVALVVTRNPGDWFEGMLMSLAAQDYPDLTIFVVDAGSDVDPTPRVAGVLPNAFVQLLEGQPGFAGAANQALASVQGAAFLMLCHDDVVLAPDTVRQLVGEAVRSNAGIVGPKIVRSDHPEILLEVGMSIDRFGVPFSGIEPGEIDQEQHDGVRDVFFVSDAAMLIRTDLFDALGGFDVDCFPGGEDLDLCWRAWLLGARVMVNPDARVGHRAAADERPALDQVEGTVRTRNRVRSVLKCSSFLGLLWTIPIGLLLALGESLAFFVVGRRRRARAVIGAWSYNLLHLGRVLRARKPVQRARVVRDRDIRYLQTRGSARLKLFATHYLRAEDRMRTLGERRSTLAAAARDRSRLPVIASVGAFTLALIIGSWELFGSVPAVGSLLPWDSVGSLWETFTSAWRYTAAGANAPAPAPIAWMTAMGVGLFGHTGMARTLVVVAALPFAAWGAVRLARAIFGKRAIAVFIGLAYAILPVGRNAIAGGRLGALVFFAVLPFFLRHVWRAANLAEAPGMDDPIRSRRIDLLVTALWGMVTVAALPAALVLLPLAVLAVWLVSLVVGDARCAWSACTRTIGALVLALVGLFPWVLGFARGFDLAAVGFVYRPGLELSDSARLVSGPSGAGIAGWFLLIAVGLPLLITSGPRFAWVARGWALIVVGWGAVWIPSELAPSFPLPTPEAVLSIAALGVAIVLGSGAILVVEELRTVGFGWRQVLAIVALLCVVPTAIGFGVDALNGRWRLPEKDWQSVLAFGQVPGGYRVLWLGDPIVLPGDPMLRGDGNGFEITRDGSGSARDLWPAPTSNAMKSVSHVITLAESAQTVSVGHELAPLGVRYIVVPDRAAPGAPVRGRPQTATLNGLALQRDLVRRRIIEPGIALYENLAWVPIRASLSGDGARSALVPGRRSLTSAVDAPLAPAPPVGGSLSKSTPVPPGALLWGEAADGAWNAQANGRTLPHVRAFGNANAYPIEATSSVALHNSWQWMRWVVVALQLGLWLVVLFVLFRHRLLYRLRARRAAESSRDGGA